MIDTSNVDFNDIEYILRPDFDNPETIIFSVQSVSQNCSTHMRFSDKMIKEQGIAGLLEILKGMKESLIYQKVNELLFKE